MGFEENRHEQGRMWEGIGETPPGSPGRADQSRGRCREGLTGEPVSVGRREAQQQSVLGVGWRRNSQTGQLCREQRP